MFLSREQVEELTGYRRPSSQIKQLRSQGVHYFVAADGYPRVPVTQVDHPGASKRGGGNAPSAAASPKKKAGPDFTALA
ncbi:DUF4224 domain-containing protein [Thioalkalivibrio sp. ALMg11]|uniref:DUF4224 domain-containing protein n=1 Tax=Thioalkalivibrio sp. ALMg11 TaxID=1158165 RepID=UPI0003661AC0|nr:DUF4224 domain-containing protein [Thioalkalivibrio sp. ALMg11]